MGEPYLVSHVGDGETVQARKDDDRINTEAQVFSIRYLQSESKDRDMRHIR